MRLIKSASAFAAIWLVSLGIWMLVVSDLSWRDFVIGLIAASLTAFAVWRVGRIMQVKVRPTFKQIAEGWRIPWYVLIGTFQVLQAIYAQLFKSGGAASIIQAIPFEYGADDARSTGRRALATTYTTITPNSIVLGWVHSSDQRESYMLLHQVTDDDVHQLTKNLGASQ